MIIRNDYLVNGVLGKNFLLTINMTKNLEPVCCCCDHISVITYYCDCNFKFNKFGWSGLTLKLLFYQWY